MKYFCSDGPGTSRVYQIGVSNLSELSELSELLASTNTVLQRNSHLRASLTISAVKRSVEALLNAYRRRQYIKKYLLQTPGRCPTLVAGAVPPRPELRGSR